MITSTDPIADMLSRIRNAATAGRGELSVPYSSVKEEVAQVLAKNRFVLKSVVRQVDGRKNILITLNDNNSNTKISHIRRLSKPGRRIYSKADKIPVVRHGRGIVILSTSAGILTGSEAKQKKLGGELICEVF